MLSPSNYTSHLLFYDLFSFAQEFMNSLLYNLSLRQSLLYAFSLERLCCFFRNPYGYYIVCLLVVSCFYLSGSLGFSLVCHNYHPQNISLLFIIYLRSSSTVGHKSFETLKVTESLPLSVLTDHLSCNSVTMYTLPFFSIIIDTPPIAFLIIHVIIGLMGGAFAPSLPTKAICFPVLPCLS